MNSKWKLFTEPPSVWKDICQEKNSIFHTTDWQSILTKSYGSFPMFALNKDKSDGFALTVFPAGPFRVGYIGFPAGGLIGAKPLNAVFVRDISKMDFPTKVHLIKLVSSPFPEPLLLNYPYAETLETIIPNLYQWQKDRLIARVRRDINKSRNTKVVIESAKQRSANFIHDLYKKTIISHGGVLRYNQNYFRTVIEISQVSSNISCWLAVLESKPIAFLIAAREGNTVFYLHGAMDRNYRQYQPSDLLIYTAIEWGKLEMAKEFNMMASPSNQPSLVRYKEKWGGVTGIQKTYDMSIASMGHLLSRLMKGYNLISRIRFR